MDIIKVKGVRFNKGDYFSLVTEELTTGQKLTKTGRPLIIFTPNPEQVVQAKTNGRFLKCLNSSDLNLIDGIGIVWYLRLKNRVQVPRTSGVDFAWKLLSFLNSRKGRVFFLGSSPEINSQAIKQVKKRFGSLQIQGNSGGNVNDSGRVDGGVIKMINKFQADILLVAFGAPKQEMFVCNYANEFNAKVVMVVGGAFDYWSGRLVRAPKWWRKLGLEWLFRLLVEPWRLKRQLRLVKFVFGN